MQRIFQKIMSKLKAFMIDDLPHNIYDPKNNTALNMKEYFDRKWAEHNNK